jgi:DNA-3-methyladenine glycosylase
MERRDAVVRPRLRRDFYARDPITLARDLLGRILFYQAPEGLLAGRIVETEAYTGAADPASHAYRGLTARNAVMFGEAGHAYVYFTYGMHYCLNVVADRKGTAGAVLLRSLEPLHGLDLMRAHGTRGSDDRLCSGPGKICRAFGLDLRHNGLDLTRGPLGIAAGSPVPSSLIAVGRRVGITRAAELPYRFALAASRSVSVKPESGQ